MLNILFSKLRFKLVLLVVAGIMFGFTVTGAFRVHTEKTRITSEMQRNGQERVALLAEAVTNLLIGYDYSNMESLAERVVQQPDVQHVIIRNRDGKVMVSRNIPSLPDQATLSFESPVHFGSKPIGKVELQISLARMQAELNNTYRTIFLEQAFFGFLLGMLIYFVASRVIVKPIARIGDHMQAQLDSPDDIEPRELRIESRDEIGDLVRIFNSLNRKVYDAQLRLQEKINLAGTALMRTNEQLQQRTMELEQRTLDLEKALSLVERLAVTDSLTDLRNRRYFDDNLAAAFARAQRYDAPICLILIDIDHFKQINDNYGHAAGDTVLQQLAGVIKGRMRETDIAARLGGDEFAYLLYHTELDEGIHFSQAILELARELRFNFEREMNVGISLSIGIASNRGNMHSMEALYGAADDALYEAKRRGRNQVVAYPFGHQPLGQLKSV